MGCNYFLITKRLPEMDNIDQEDILFNNAHEMYETDGIVFPVIKEFNSVLHIGKSSFGWHFLLCVYKELGINTFEDWCNLFDDDSNIIVNEYHEIITKNSMIEIITNRQDKRYMEILNSKLFKSEKQKKEQIKILENSYILNSSYMSYDDFLIMNHAERGKNGLIKHIADGIHDIIDNNTGGTYDYTRGWNFW